MAAQATPPVDYKALAARHGSVYSIHESDAAYIPPEVQRIQHAVGMQLKAGAPLPDGGISSVGEHETSTIEINDPQKFAQGPLQTVSHETGHLWQNSLPPKLIAQIPPDDPKHPYALDLDKLDAMRKQGMKLNQLPREMSASLIQRWVASPQDRPRLQAWLADLNSTPLSVEMPTPQGTKGIISQIRPPTPPVEAWQNPQDLRKQADELQSKFKRSGFSQ
jgi:hypothetical protein